jgi:hypothetical protein
MHSHRTVTIKLKMHPTVEHIVSVLSDLPPGMEMADATREHDHLGWPIITLVFQDFPKEEKHYDGKQT